MSPLKKLFESFISSVRRDAYKNENRDDKDGQEMYIMGVYNQRCGSPVNVGIEEKEKKRLYVYEGNKMCRQSFHYVFT